MSMTALIKAVLKMSNLTTDNYKFYYKLNKDNRYFSKIMSF